MGTLTPRQLQVVDFIREFTAENGFAPTLAEIAERFDVTKGTAQQYVAALEDKGVLQRKRYERRSIEIVDETPGMLPLVGRIAAGSPIEAVEDTEWIDVTQLLSSGREGETYLLEVKGDSMIEDGILKGDYVVVEKRDTAEDGDTVVALLPDGSATLKRFYRRKGKIRLQPANARMKPIVLKEVTIQGVVRGVIRSVRKKQ